MYLPGPITHVFLTPPWLIGIFSLRGEIVPAVDLAAWLGLPATLIGDESRLVLSDAPHARERRAEPIAFRDEPTTADANHVAKVIVSQEVRPGRYTVRDYDTRLPADYALAAGAKGGAGVEDRLERFHFVPGAFLFAGASGEGTPTADDRGTARSDEAEAAALAQRRLEASRGPR